MFTMKTITGDFSHSKRYSFRSYRNAVELLAKNLQHGAVRTLARCSIDEFILQEEALTRANIIGCEALSHSKLKWLKLEAFNIMLQSLYIMEKHP